MSSPVGRRIDLIEWRSLGDLTSLLEQTFLNDACDLWSDFRHEGSNDASWQFGRDGDGFRMQPDNADMGRATEEFALSLDRESQPASARTAVIVPIIKRKFIDPHFQDMLDRSVRTVAALRRLGLNYVRRSSFVTI